MPPRAILLDFEGVLADTENVHVAAWERTLGLLGWEVPTESCVRGSEMDDHDFLTDIFFERGIVDGNIKGWVRRKQSLTRQLLADVPSLYPGAAELIRQLHGKGRLAVVATTWRENVEVVLNSAGVLDLIGVVVSKELIRSPKPNPACYRRALKLLDAPKEQAVVLVASFYGFTAASQAAIRTLAVGHRMSKESWPLRTPFVPDLTSPPDVLKALGFAPPPK